MTFNLQYLSDSHGKNTAVVIPVSEWKTIEKALRKSEFKSKLMEELRDAFREIKQIENGKSKGKKAEDFLREL